MGISPKDYWERRGRMTGEAARRLREARQARGWTQRTLAGQTGVGHGVVSQAERGQLHIAAQQPVEGDAQRLGEEGRVGRARGRLMPLMGTDRRMPLDWCIALGRRVRQRREQLGLTQVEVSVRMGRRPPGPCAKLEAGDVFAPSLPMALCLARALGCSLHWLLTGAGPAEPPA